MKRSITYTTATLLLCAPIAAHAQPPAQQFDKAAKPEPATDATEAAISAGGMLTAGNSKSLNVNAGATARVRRGDHQGKFEAGAAFGSAKVAPEGTSVRSADVVTVTETFSLGARYDYFFSENVSGFVRATALHDRFKDLALRLDLTPGVSFYIINEKSEQLNIDVGYDYQHDWAIEGEDKTLHNALVGLSYHNAFNPAVSLDLGLAYVQAFSPFKTAGDINMRLDGMAALNAKVSDKFSVSTSLDMKYDNNPGYRAIANDPADATDDSVERLERTDIVTKLSLVYNLL